MTVETGGVRLVTNARCLDPDHAVVGLRNHGITATGEGLDEILERIGSKVVSQVPML